VVALAYDGEGAVFGREALPYTLSPETLSPFELRAETLSPVTLSLFGLKPLNPKPLRARGTTLNPKPRGRAGIPRRGRSLRARGITPCS